MRGPFHVVWIDEPIWSGERHEIRVERIHSAKRLARVLAACVKDRDGNLIADYSEVA